MSDVDDAVHRFLDELSMDAMHNLNGTTDVLALELNIDRAVDALRDVLNLHEPAWTNHKRKRDRWLYCTECLVDCCAHAEYPCDTVKAIAKAVVVSR